MWCEVWKENMFDPDDTWPSWAKTGTSPLQAYHHATTVLRNEASHAKTSNSCFDWRDVWGMVLTFMLKVEGLTRRSLTHSSAYNDEDKIQELSSRLDAALQSVV